MRLVTTLTLALLLAPAALAQPCDPADTSEPCPDTTAAHRYFPLEVGNQWQYYQPPFEEPATHWSWRITGETEIGGQTYFELVRCDEAGDGSADCAAPVPIRYDAEHAMIVRRDGDEETWWDELPCRLDVDFNGTEEFYECTGPGIEEGQFTPATGRYGATVEVLPDTLSGDTHKGFSRFAHQDWEVYAGLGVTAFRYELQGEPTRLVHAIVGGEQVGTPAFATCDPSEPDGIPCPDTTDWRRYFPPLAVGNQWQYNYEGFCSDIDPCRTGREVVGSEVIEGVEHFLVRWCRQYIEGNVTCTEPVLVSYETYGLEECILSLPFNYSGVPNCEGYDYYHHISGRYGGVFDLGEGPSLEGTMKEVDSIGGFTSYFAGVGRTSSTGDGSEFGEYLIYARIDGVEYGTPAFAMCDPSDSDPDIACPDTTDWRRYMPLAVGNEWQYREPFAGYEVYWGWRITGETEIGGRTYFELERCNEAEDGTVSCGEPQFVRYSDEYASVVRYGEDGDTWWPGVPCRLDLPFGGTPETDFYECEGGVFERYFGVWGEYDAMWNLPPDVVSGDTRKHIGVGAMDGVTLYAGLGLVSTEDELHPEPTQLVYARIHGETYGTPAFSFPTADEPGASAPAAFALRAVYPNPAGEAAVVAYALDRAQDVTLEVLDVLGRVVRTEEVGAQAAGPHEAHVATDVLPSGLYLVRLRGEDAEATRRLVVLR